MSSNREDFASPPQSSAEAASHVIELLLLIFLLGSLSTFKRALIKFVPTSILWLCGWLVTLTFLAAPISIGSKVLRALAKTVPKEWRASTPELLPLSFERDLDGGGYVALFVFVISTLFCGWKGIQAWQIERLHSSKVSDLNISKLRRKVSKLHRNRRITEPIRAKMDDLLVRNEYSGVSTHSLLRQISADIGGEFGTETKLEMQRQVDEILLAGQTTFLSDIIQRRLKMELGLLNDAAVAWWQLVLNGASCSEEEHDSMDIDILLSLESVTNWCNTRIDHKTVSSQTNTNTNRLKCSQASVLAMVPHELLKDQHCRGKISHEMFAEIHRFVTDTLLCYLVHNEEALTLWRAGHLRLGDMNAMTEENISDCEIPLEDASNNSKTLAGGVFRIRLYNRKYVSNELFLVFSMAHQKQYVFLIQWKREDHYKKVEYVWMTKTTPRFQLRSYLIGHIVDILWPYLCYVETSNGSHRLLAAKCFCTPHYISSWNRRYSSRLRALLISMVGDNNNRVQLKERLDSIVKDQQVVAACASGIGKCFSLDGSVVILPHFVLLNVWHCLGWHDGPPSLRDRQGRAMHPPPPRNDDIGLEFLQEMK
mgnify:CR=1 FL=1